MSESKDAADVTETPEGLDVAITVPGTIVGSHDLQGTDGTERTDRPGEILGTPATGTHDTSGREREIEKADYVTAEVDRANREELPKLGGAVDDGWVAGEEGRERAETRKADAATRKADREAGRTTDIGVTTAKVRT